MKGKKEACFGCWIEKIANAVFRCNKIVRAGKSGILTPTKLVVCLKYYLKHEHEYLIKYKTRGAAERFIADKARIASVLNSLKNDPFYTVLSLCLQKNF